MNFTEKLNRLSQEQFSYPYLSLKKVDQATIGWQILPEYQDRDKRVLNMMQMYKLGLINPGDPHEDELIRMYVADFIIKDIHIAMRERPWTETLVAYYQVFQKSNDDELISLAIMNYLAICSGFAEILRQA